MYERLTSFSLLSFRVRALSQSGATSHWRFSWEQRLSRNARPASSSPVTITLHGLPAAFVQIYGFELSNAS